MMLLSAFSPLIPQHLIVLDMSSKGIDGAETYPKILEFNAIQKAIIMAGYSEFTRVKEAQNAWAGVFLSKPFSPAKLAREIHKQLDLKNGDR